MKYCCDQIVEQSKQKMPPFKNGKSKKMSRDVPTFCFINGAHIQSMKMVIMDIAKHLGIEQKNPQTCNIEKILKTGRESSSNRFLVVVIDEIDLLLSSKKSSGAGNSGEKILSVLLNWASSESFSFGLIGISNAVGNHYAHRLSNLGPVSCLDHRYRCFHFVLFFTNLLLLLFIDLRRFQKQLPSLHTGRKILLTSWNEELGAPLLIPRQSCSQLQKFRL